MASLRISDEPAYVLHRHDWSESSLILEVFTRNHGRVALVAKGAKRPSSGLRPILLPLQPLHVAFGGDAEIRTLRSAEWMGGHVMPDRRRLAVGLLPQRTGADACWHATIRIPGCSTSMPVSWP